MIHIYTPDECPKWIKEKCEALTETKDGVRYTCYKESKAPIYYVVHQGINISTVLYLCQQLEEQTFKLENG